MKTFVAVVLLSFMLPIFVLASSDTTATTVNQGSQVSVTSVENQLKGILASLFNKVDPWRQKQAQYFSELRDKTKAELGIKTTKDFYDTITPKTPEAPAVPGSQQEGETIRDLSPKYSDISIIGYITLIYATALATLFSSIALFYVASVLLALLVLRLIIRLLI